MKLFDRFRNSSPAAEAGEADTAAVASSPDSGQLPIAGYDSLDDKKVVAELSALSQVELAEVESYERAHANRPVVLNRIRWLQSPEPMEGYDALDDSEVAGALAGADSGTLRAVRDYERRHRNRRDVLLEVERVLPESSPSADQTRKQDEKDERVRASMRRKR